MRRFEYDPDKSTQMGQEDQEEMMRQNMERRREEEARINKQSQEHQAQKAETKGGR